jgi:hypothetical protein
MNWYSELDLNGKRTFIASFLGWSIDALDYMVFTFVISTLIHLWGINLGQAGMLGTVTLLFSAIGGWGAGILADRYGRVRMLQITIHRFYTELQPNLRATRIAGTGLWRRMGHWIGLDG